LQKGFDEFAFAANGQAGKSLEPFACRHFGVGIQPLREQDDLSVGKCRARAFASKDAAAGLRANSGGGF
jgi:hypothetical protein